MRHPALLALFLLAGPGTLAAQVAEPAGHVADSAAAVAPDTASRAPSRLHSTLWSAGGAALATIAVLPLDASLAEALQDPGPQKSAALRHGASFFNTVGSPGVLLASLGMYGAGRVSGQQRLTTMGAHATQAIVLSGATTALIKVAAGRQRPYVQPGDADDFAPGRGLRSGRTSFPSGHTTAAFAFAAAVSSDLHDWRPEVARVAGPLLYAGAATVGVARMYSDRHWASDVVLGAGIGTLVGRGLVERARANPDNWLDRQFRAVSILPATGGGVALSARYSFR